MIIFDSKEYDLLWTLIKEFDEKDSDIIWLTRASAYIITKNQTHKNELIKHYETTQKNHYDKLGAYLMGLKNEKEIIDIINTDKKRCEVSYYLGLKAESNKKYQEASKWYHISILTGLKNNGEYRWAYDYLFKLNNTQKTFKNGIEALK
jgi:lipoprotein NlpI